MKTWNQLQDSAKRLDIEIQIAGNREVSLVDIASLRSLVTVTIGHDVHHEDRDFVLRAATSAALAAIRRRGT